MKEENKKTTTKKTPAKKKTTNTKSSTTKKATTKKSPVKKTSATKKTTSKKVSAAKSTTATKKISATVPVKKASVKKTPVKKTPVKKVEEVKEVKKEVIEDSLNKDLIMRTILIIAYTIIIVILVIGFVDSMINIASQNEDKKTYTSYMINNKIFSDSNTIEIEDAKFKLSALSGDYFIYLSYSDEALHSFEKELTKLIRDNNLQDKFYYINIDKIKDEDNLIDLVNKFLGYSDVLVSKVPTIIYVNKDNIVRTENIITRLDNNLITIDDVSKLLDINGYELKK